MLISRFRGPFAVELASGKIPSTNAVQQDLIVASVSHDLVRATLRIRKRLLVGRFPSQGLVYLLAEDRFERQVLGTGGRGQPLSRFRFASRSTTLTIGEVAAASGSAATLKRGATGKPFCTFAFIASGEVIQAIASKASSTRSGGRFEGMQSRKPPIGLLEAPPGPRGCGR